MATSNVITKVGKSPITVAEIRVSDWQKAGTKTAVLKQSIKTISSYPTKTVTSDMQDSIFSLQDFGFETQDFVSERTYVAFIAVPENATVESVTAQLAKFPKASLYRVLSNEPILTNNQKNAIERGLRTLDEFANSQVLRYGEGTEKAGQLLLDSNGKVQYKAVYFASQGHEDIDLRTQDERMYLSPELEVEYNESILVNA
jgi:hypothetical protein